ncbi:MAG: RNA chaperone Hfq [Candidatus Competibacteraceae bacterium]
MRDHLTLKSTHPPDQATDSDEPPSQESGKRPPPALQSAFLTDLQDRLVTVYLVNGIKLVGKVRQFDSYTLLLQGADGTDSLIFKHAISSIIPGAPAVTRERRTPFGRSPEWTG